ncbi:MAG: MFS transporter [Conexivisphaerales archaeon]|nr:MFS transporter [Conexivisphaerales archaeon]
MSFIELDEKPLNRFIVYMTILVGFGTFLDGYDLLNVSIALPFLIKVMKITTAIQGMLGTATYLGGIFGAVIFGVFSDLRGRKSALILDLFFFFIASFVSAFVSNVTQLIAIRLAIGFGIGADIVSGPALLSEMLPKNKRGTMLGISLLMMPLGGLVSVLVAYMLYSSGISANIIWRIIFALGAIPALIVILLRSYLPESPRWLAKFGDPKKHVREFRTFGINVQKNERQSYLEIFRKYKRGLAYSSIAWFTAGTTSMLTIFTPLILQRFVTKGYFQLISLTLTVWIFALFGALVSALLQDYAGRKKLAVVSIMLLGVSYVLLGFSLLLSVNVLELILSLAMFFSFMNVGVAYAVQTEVFPTDLKSFSDGLAFSINRVANFAFGSLVPVLLALGVLTHFLWFSGLLVMLLAVVLAALGIETKNKSLERIEEELAEREITD